MQELSVAILHHLQSSVGIKVDDEEQGRQYTESQALLCATLAVCITLKSFIHAIASGYVMIGCI